MGRLQMRRYGVAYQYPMALRAAASRSMAAQQCRDRRREQDRQNESVRTCTGWTLTIHVRIEGSLGLISISNYVYIYIYIELAASELPELSELAIASSRGGQAVSRLRVN